MSESAEPNLPGLEPGSPALIAELRRALQARPAGYEARTHHKNASGDPLFSNRLILETSPYLLQHAHNPVNWRPWGEAAFAAAKRRGVPVLLSIGYSTCHWCHVMERESFEDLEIARFINENFVAIKVDREERPDIDDIYMSAVQMLTGRGGWPMTVVLTPEALPFFAGTYFPARDGDRGSRKGFLTILRELSQNYKTDPDAVLRDAQRVTDKLIAAVEHQRPGNVPGPEAIQQNVRRLALSFDAQFGGFGTAPKFPRPVSYALLLRYHRRTGDALALRIVTESLTKMAAGGMYDHLGGGFHRYSTDARWLVPHFEKMLYDNAQLASLYLEAFQVSKEQAFADVALDILAYVDREMSDAEGAFHSATDADSLTPSGHQDEGYFFTWTPNEFEEVLGMPLARVAASAWGVQPGGNFEGRSILHLENPLVDTARDLKISVEALKAQLATAREKLYAVRLKRPAPGKDNKVVLSWNGLMISAFAQAGFMLDMPTHTARGVRAAKAILGTMRQKDGRLWRTRVDGRSANPAMLDDHAFMIQACLDLFEATSDEQWLNEAIALQEVLDRLYADTASGGYFMVSQDHESLLARPKPSYDGAEPTGNAVEARNLLRLHTFTGDETYRQLAEGVFAAFAHSMQSMPAMLSALDYYLDTPLELVVVHPKEQAPPTLLMAALRHTFLPNKALSVVTEGETQRKLQRKVPWLEGKTTSRQQAVAYVCKHGRCELPTSDPKVLLRQLQQVTAFKTTAAPPLPTSAPKEQPKPWQYDSVNDRHWHPGHGHWHNGRPNKKI